MGIMTGDEVHGKQRLTTGMPALLYSDVISRLSL